MEEGVWHGESNIKGENHPKLFESCNEISEKIKQTGDISTFQLELMLGGLRQLLYPAQAKSIAKLIKDSPLIERLLIGDLSDDKQTFIERQSEFIFPATVKEIENFPIINRAFRRACNNYLKEIFHTSITWNFGNPSAVDVKISSDVVGGLLSFEIVNDRKNSITKVTVSFRNILDREVGLKKLEPLIVYAINLEDQILDRIKQSIDD